MTTEPTKTAAELRSEAAQHEQDSHDSFARCDTDGFLSQWASQQMSDLKRRQADIAQAGGVWTFQRTVLLTLDGQPTDARAVQTRYGTKWRLDSSDQWLPYQPARESTLAKRGYREVTETEVAPAKVIHWAPRHGGATSVQTIIIRTDRPKADGWQPAGAPEA
jgi:hypothetical protein